MKSSADVVNRSSSPRRLTRVVEEGKMQRPFFTHTLWCSGSVGTFVCTRLLTYWCHLSNINGRLWSVFRSRRRWCRFPPRAALITVWCSAVGQEEEFQRVSVKMCSSHFLFLPSFILHHLLSTVLPSSSIGWVFSDQLKLCLYVCSWHQESSDDTQGRTGTHRTRTYRYGLEHTEREHEESVVKWDMKTCRCVWRAVGLWWQTPCWMSSHYICPSVDLFKWTLLLFFKFSSSDLWIPACQLNSTSRTSSSGVTRSCQPARWRLCVPQTPALKTSPVTPRWRDFKTCWQAVGGGCDGLEHLIDPTRAARARRNTGSRETTILSPWVTWSE